MADTVPSYHLSGPAQTKQQIDEVAKLLDAFKKYGGEVPTPITKIIGALQTGAEVGMSANEANDALRRFLADLDNQCAQQFPGNTDNAVENHTICEAQSTFRNNEQASAVRAVLAENNPQSAVRIELRKKMPLVNLLLYKDRKTLFYCIISDIKAGKVGSLGQCFNE